MTRFPLRLLVVSSVVHYQHAGALHAYAPYVRELDQWASLFRHVDVAAPCRTSSPPEDCAAFAAGNLSIQPQPELGGTSWRAKLWQGLQVPRLAVGLRRAMRGADAIHVRCPGNLGLVAVVLAPLCSRRLIAKYAAQWRPYPGEPLTYRLQRRVLASRWWHGPVTVYGDWPGQPAHIVPFFTAALDARQLARAGEVARARRAHGGPLHVLFVGRLDVAKNADTVLDAIALTRGRGRAVVGTIVGDGPARAALEQLAAERGLAGLVRFTGALPIEHVLAWYEAADALVLVSESEGFPKAVAEGMAFGLSCIGADRGFVPTMLADGRGLVVPPRDGPRLADALCQLADQPSERLAMGARGSAWAQRHSIEALRDAIGDLLAERWPPQEPPAASPSAPLVQRS